MTLQTLRRVAEDLKAAVSTLEPERLSGPDAARLLEVFAEIEKLAMGGKLLSARRVESSNVWRRNGHRSAAAQVAEATGTGLGPAINALQAARQVGALPATEEALRNGRLSETQVKEIAGAATLRPDAEQELVDAAEHQPVNVLKLRCRRVKATGQDQSAVYEAIRRGRYLRNWTDGDGAVRFDARLTPDEGARLVAAVKVQTERLAREAKQAGHEEPRKALAADALVGLACGQVCSAGDGSPRGNRDQSVVGSSDPTDPAGPGRERGPGCSHAGPGAMIHVRVDHEALMRGHVETGEICEIPGIGPIPVDVARRLAADSILSVLVTDGVDVTGVAHSGRTIPTSLRRALVERDQTCVVPGCEVRERLEIDHLQPFAEGGPTSLVNLVRLCQWHHYLKTHQRHRLERTDQGWRWISPDDSRSGGSSLQRSG
jgi:hypothetical protein